MYVCMLCMVCVVCVVCMVSMVSMVCMICMVCMACMVCMVLWYVMYGMLCMVCYVWYVCCVVVWCCVVLRCVVLYCIVLYCIVLYLCNYLVLYLGNIKTTCSSAGMHSTLLFTMCAAHIGTVQGSTDICLFLVQMQLIYIYIYTEQLSQHKFWSKVFWVPDFIHHMHQLRFVLSDCWTSNNYWWKTPIPEASRAIDTWSCSCGSDHRLASDHTIWPHSKAKSCFYLS